MKHLTQAELKSLISYDSESGLFTRMIEGAPVILRPRKTLSIAGTSYQAKDLVWLYVTGAPPKGTVVHLNHDRLDFRFQNLADASASEMQAMRRPWGKHGKGVHFVVGSAKPWRAIIYDPERQANEDLGRYASQEEAAGIFGAKYRELYGQFARLA